MKKLLLIAAVFIGGLSAQQAGSYYGWRGAYGPVVSANSPVGYTDEFVDQGFMATEADSWAYCIDPPGVQIFMSFSMGSACPEGVYISEDSSNGYNPDNPPPNQTMWNLMVQNGSSIDGSDGFTLLEIFQQTYSCSTYYIGPQITYDVWWNECIGGF